MTDFLALLQSESEVSLRVALTKAKDEWLMQTMVLTVAPDLANPSWTVFDYEHIVFIARTMPGEEIAKWLPLRRGELEGYSFEIPELNEQIRSERFPSHSRYRGFEGLWQPHSVYELHSKFSRSEPKQKRDPLVHDGCPSFPALGVAAFKHLFDRDVNSDSGFPTTTIILRVAHIEAWIDRVELKPNSLCVTVQGDAVSGARLEVTGSPDTRFDEKLRELRKIEFPFPDGLPQRLWLLLSRDSRWLDLRDLNQYGTSSPWENVITSPPDLATQVSGVIARGEGEKAEFKESVPPHDERMLKTVAAFANGEGGMIVIGVVNGTGEIKGMKCDVGREKDRIKQMIRSKVHPEPKTQVEQCDVNGQTVIAIIVEEGEQAPYGVGSDPENLSYHVRRGATTPPARQSEIRIAARRNMVADNSHDYWRS
ncbi:MAG: ATP-binding protein [Pyrinomonadaceae bacterium]|nr:ATP-binding protein [Pyrinomonadaceae bacterium]